MSTVSLEAVTKRYGTVSALESVSLEIEQGEFFALLGPSGSGKTTLLRAVAGFVSPDSGTVRIGSESMARVPVAKRNIGMVFQHYALFPHMSVFDNVAFGLDVRRIERAKARRRVHDMLELLEMSGLEARKPSQLSGGQQQRVAIARALVPEPSVLLLDEPLGALDRRLRQQMQIELKRIQREVGITTVFVTHDQEEALSLSDRIALMNHGEVVQTGAPGEVYERPRTRFAAGFLGDMNVFDGPVRESAANAGKSRVTVDVGAHDLVHASGPTPQGAASVSVGVRPEKMRIEARERARADAYENALEGVVEHAVYGGSSISYRVRCGKHALNVFEQNRSATPHAVGEIVRLTWPVQHTIVLES